MTPPALDHVVRRCLENDPDDRWQSAHDIGTELQWITGGGWQLGLAVRRWLRRPKDPEQGTRLLLSPGRGESRWI